MFEWIAQHKAVLTVFTNLGTLCIWLVYAQLLYWGFRRQRRPRLIINRGKQKDINALCIISNMSAESIFIEYIIAELETNHGTIVMDVTDFEMQYNEGESVEKDGERPSTHDRPLAENTRQGPLGSGDFLHIGTFDGLIRRMARDEGIEMEGHRPCGDLEFRSLTIRLIGIYGPEDMPIGAVRSFRLQDNDRYCSLTPTSWDTRRLASRRERRQLRREVQKLNSTNFSVSSSFQQAEK